MLASKYRFHGRGSIMHTFRRGQVHRSSALQIRVFAKKSGGPKVAVVVSKKVDKKAVVRNRIRRRIFTHMENQRSRLGSNDLVISVFDNSISVKPSGDVAIELDDLLKKAGL